MAESPLDAPEILSRSPEEGARRLALAYLEQAEAALPRLAGGGDPEALHDLRVALRRLRSCLKSYDEQLDTSVPRRLARRLRRLARATGPGRDAEVMIAWLRGRTGEPGPNPRGHRHGKAWLLARLEARKEKAYSELRDELEKGFGALAEGLRRRLSVYRAEVHLDETLPPSFGEAAAGVLHDHAARLGRRLGRIESAGDQEEAHAARIAAKRLRYLADPLAQLIQESHQQPAGQLVQHLKKLQDLLGELHDAHVLEAELAKALAAAAAERARRLLELTLAGGDLDPRRLRAERRRVHEPGLLALARQNRSRRDRLFAEFAERWQGERAEQLLRDAEELEEALRAAGHAGQLREGEETAVGGGHPPQEKAEDAAAEARGSSREETAGGGGPAAGERRKTATGAAAESARVSRRRPASGRHR
jgi:CHAD domain-containing protein